MPLIKQLMEDNVVILGVTKTTSLIFDEEFPQLKKVDVIPYDIRYSKSLTLAVKLLADAPRIFKVIKRERKQLAQIIKDYQIDVVISDNRFGLFHKNTECIYITHQLNIQAGLFSFIANKIHHYYMAQFNTVWVPDLEDRSKSLAGELSRKNRAKNVEYIGYLSRLPIIEIKENTYDYLCLLSGPEPLRTKLERVLIKKANESDKQICIVRGSRKELKFFTNKNVTVVNTPVSDELAKIITHSTTIVCRSGYSTLMDLHHLQKKNCILIPTPGQEEQEYLAGYWSQKFGSQVIREKELSSFSFI
ncbi:MAG: glycosyltransferase [Bacteroidia bacterium]|nr:glycosyltransferase [Bacteroidia bacterium]